MEVGGKMWAKSVLLYACHRSRTGINPRRTGRLQLQVMGGMRKTSDFHYYLQNPLQGTHKTHFNSHYRSSFLHLLLFASMYHSKRLQVPTTNSNWVYLQ